MMMAVTVCFSHVGCNVRFSERTGVSSRVVLEDEELNEHRLLLRVPQAYSGRRAWLARGAILVEPGVRCRVLGSNIQ